MRLNQKLRIVESNNLSVVVKDDTGFANTYNPYGYRDDLEEVEAYIFVVEDSVRREDHKTVIENDESIQYGVEVTLSGDDRFKDSLYNIQMYTRFNIEMSGDGFEGLDFISNVAGASAIGNNYSVIIVDTDVYKIVKVEKDTIFLDRVLKTDVETFKLGFYAEEKVALYTDLQDSIIKATERLTDCCSDAETVNKLASLHLYLKGVEESVKRGSYETAEKLLNYANEVSRYLNRCSEC